jgi:hypothetical protein
MDDVQKAEIKAVVKEAITEMANEQTSSFGRAILKKLGWAIAWGLVVWYVKTGGFK